MKNLNSLKLVAVSLALMVGSSLAQSFYRSGLSDTENRSTLVIKADGSCAFTNETIQPRKALQMQISSWERFASMEQTMDEEEAPANPAAPAKPPVQKDLTNEEMAAKLRQVYEARPEFGETDVLRVENVEGATNLVRLLTARAFSSLKELLSESPYTWGPNALMHMEARFEIDTNRNLRITFPPTSGAARYARSAARDWKSSKIKFEWRLVLPGKVLSSALPGTQENTTWIKVDGEKPETLEAALKLIASPLVITAEAGGLKLDEPLESKKLVRAAWAQRKAGPELPITEAGPGFLAEAVGITLSTVYKFPEGEKLLKAQEESSMFGTEKPGTVVSAKLFPPKGREIRSIGNVRLKAAKDDKGRALTGSAETGEDDQDYQEFRSYSSGDAETTGAARFEVRLGLPSADARSIDELNCEAVALTIGGWKEMTLTNVQADAQKGIDLGEVLPGARLFIKKLGGRPPQRTIDATLEGPATVQQLELKVKASSRQGGQSSSSDRRTTTSGNKTVRTLVIQSFEYSMGEEAKKTPLTLLIRYPQDVKRERVQFKLTGLDLL